jgi:pimeloyl-ACP methyl ester carboxylesterase
VATLVTEQGIVHYEAYGRGRPVLLLHGWMNSWAVWRPTVEIFGKDFRVYAIDFFGFGESGGGGDYSVTNFVQLVNEFMERMGIVKAPIVGHSMGGTVGLSAALRFPEKIVKVVAVGSPIEGASLSPLLRLAAFPAWQDVTADRPYLFKPVQNSLRVFLKGYSHLLAKDGARLGTMLSNDVAKLSAPSFLESIGTLRQTDLRPRLKDLKLPVLGVYGTHDRIVDPGQAKVLKESMPASEVLTFKGSGHFPMLDEPDRFHAAVRGFLMGTVPVPGG